MAVLLVDNTSALNLMLSRGCQLASNLHTASNLCRWVLLRPGTCAGLLHTASNFVVGSYLDLALVQDFLLLSSVQLLLRIGILRQFLLLLRTGILRQS